MERTRLKFNNRQEWLAARTQGIGASEVGTIIGLNPFETPYQLWRRKRGLDEPKEETMAMRDGHFLEGAVAEYFGSVTGAQILKNSVEDFMFVSVEKPFMRVSPDRVYWGAGVKRSEANKSILECKSTSKSVSADDLPKHWFAQLQMNLGVSGYDSGAIAWFCKRDGVFGHCDVLFSPDFFAWLVEEVERFWTDYVVGGREPEATEVSDILLKYNRHTDGKIVEVSPDVFDQYAELKDLKSQISELEGRKKALEDKIKVAFADAEAITFGGETLATWKAAKDSLKFDEKAFREANPELYNQYVKPVAGSRRLLLK